MSLKHLTDFFKTKPRPGRSMNVWPRENVVTNVARPTTMVMLMLLMMMTTMIHVPEREEAPELNHPRTDTPYSIFCRFNSERGHVFSISSHFTKRRQRQKMVESPAHKN